jgi:hypothetical protein
MVPEQFYNGLLDSTTISDFSKKLVDDTLSSNKMNASVKKRLLNQRMRGYLKHKRSEEDRPVKVILDQDQIGVLSDKVDIETPKPPTNVKPKNGLKPKNGQKGKPKNGQNNGTPNDILITNGSNEKSLPPPLQSTGERLAKIIRTNLGEFKISSDGTVKNNAGRNIQRSNYKDIIEFIINGSPKRGRYPNGANDLISRLWKSEKTRDLMNELSKPAISPKKRLNIENWK